MPRYYGTKFIKLYTNDIYRDIYHVLCRKRSFIISKSETNFCIRCFTYFEYMFQTHSNIAQDLTPSDRSKSKIDLRYRFIKMKDSMFHWYRDRDERNINL